MKGKIRICGAAFCLRPGAGDVLGGVSVESTFALEASHKLPHILKMKSAVMALACAASAQAFVAPR